MKELIQYEQNGDVLDIKGTNQFLDIFISLLCLPWRGVHLGASLAAKKLFKKIKIEGLESLCIRGYSMGGGIAQSLAVLIRRKRIPMDIIIELTGSYPALSEDMYVGDCSVRIYGNDPVPGLFPWFKYPHGSEIIHEGPPRKWWRINFKDHTRY